MNRRVFAMILTLSLCLSLVSGCASKPSAGQTSGSVNKPKELKISSGPSGGNWYAMGASFSDLLTKAGVPTSAVPGGGTQNIVAVGSGKADLGFCALASLNDAYKGAQPYDKQYKDIVMLMRLDNNPAYFIVHADSPIKDITQIKGKKVAGPAPGTSSQQIIGDVFKAYGISEEKDMSMRRGSMSEGAELFKDRNTDVYAVTTGIGNATIVDIATSVPVRFLSVPDEIINKMIAGNPGYSRVVIPAKTYRGQDQDIVTVTSDAALIANKNMPDDHAYWIVKTLSESFDTLRKTHAWLQPVKNESLGVAGSMPMHPGAQKYFTKK